MKRLLVASLIATMMIASPCGTACLGPVDVAAEETPISIHIESEYGILDFVRYELNGNDLFLVFDYQNTTSETNMPIFQYQTSLFQNGKEVTSGFSMNRPSDCDLGSTNIRPGSTIRYSVVYNLTELSPVELEVYPLFDFTGKYKQVVDINLGSTEVAPDPSAVTPEISAEATPSAETEELTRQLSEANARIAELEAQLSEANAKVDVLQGQLDAIKAAIGN